MQGCRIAARIVACHEDADVTGFGFLSENVLGFCEERRKLAGFRDNYLESFADLFVLGQAGTLVVLSCGADHSTAIQLLPAGIE
jgi:hypothetical protein